MSSAHPPEYVKVLDKYDISVRMNWVKQSREQYPNKIPVILEPNADELGRGVIQAMNNPKFLFPVSFDCIQVSSVLRRKLSINQYETILLFVRVGDKHQLIKGGTALQDVYAKYKNEDGMLYMVYARENVFG